MLNTGCGFLLCLAWRKTGCTLHPQDGRSIASHTKGMKIFSEHQINNYEENCIIIIGGADVIGMRLDSDR